MRYFIIGAVPKYCLFEELIPSRVLKDFETKQHCSGILFTVNGDCIDYQHNSSNVVLHRKADSSSQLYSGSDVLILVSDGDHVEQMCREIQRYIELNEEECRRRENCLGNIMSAPSEEILKMTSMHGEINTRPVHEQRYLLRHALDTNSCMYLDFDWDFQVIKTNGHYRDGSCASIYHNNDSWDSAWAHVIHKMSTSQWKKIIACKHTIIVILAMAGLPRFASPFGTLSTDHIMILLRLLYGGIMLRNATIGCESLFHQYKYYRFY
jgi:hypothetical protein